MMRWWLEMGVDGFRLDVIVDTAADQPGSYRPLSGAQQVAALGSRDL